MMAMMMTGRVLLLVCALCVLWCGVSVVMASNVGGFALHADISVLFGRWYSLMMRDCESTSAFKNGTVNESAVGECKREAKKALCDFFYGDHSGEHDASHLHSICLPDVGTGGAVDQQAQEQISTLRETGKPAPPTTPQGLSEELPDPPPIPALEGTPASAGASSQAPPIQASTEPTVTAKQAEPNTAGSVPPTQSQGGPETMRPPQEPPKLSSIPDTGTQRDPPTEDRAEQTLSPAKANDNSNDYNEEDTAEESTIDTPASGAVQKEGNESETPGSGLKKTKTPHTTVEGSNTVKPGDGESSPTGPPAGESDAATTTTTNNHDPRSLNNNGNNTFTEEVDQKEATRKPKNAPDSTDTAAAKSEASATAINISTNTTKKTTTGDSSTAVSHTTFPLLLLLVACAAAAAVVAA
ncbi:mucin-associated surface protein (MASP), putative [Trypanosoma cruzi]|uniref:Mucin-associated surface protein (MASP), putative n=2 Tax=Trypanosoma cruzi TaxID=5693 RepID=Q4DKJ5_TRYCC|nr:mucin-associated surface protein (MASP), putative [Trypanosoma cruzi]EAN93049.1 mucin-associated surface protein (MASP), putative [Trypanosoma cruzi]|eukprot:XP_814900.1 mucin-associated surface protein (MASP) [Trypanosoma cruzi strain CL Brener]